MTVKFGLAKDPFVFDQYKVRLYSYNDSKNDDDTMVYQVSNSFMKIHFCIFYACMAAHLCAFIPHFSHIEGKVLRKQRGETK